MPLPKVSICIATYNMEHLITETLYSCLNQAYTNKEIFVYDDCSTDDTFVTVLNVMDSNLSLDMKYRCGEKNLGVGDAFNAAIAHAAGDIIVLMCADDLFTHKRVIPDMVNVFEVFPTVGYVTRYYKQFVGNDHRAVRAWHCYDPIILANNPSGLAFRRTALEDFKCSNKMFIETSYLAYQVMENWQCHILEYDAIAARVHASTSTKSGYYLKRRVSSPVMDWYELGAHDIAKDYVSLIQIKCNFTMEAVWEEIRNFVKVRPKNLLNPLFYVCSMMAIITPRKLLRQLPHFYRKYIGGFITKEIKRP